MVACSLNVKKVIGYHLSPIKEKKKNPPKTPATFLQEPVYLVGRKPLQNLGYISIE